MLIYFYDGTFAGLLTCIFECYNLKQFPDAIYAPGKVSSDIFAKEVIIETDTAKSERVWKGIQPKLSPRNRQLLYYAFLSEAEGIEMSILKFARRLFAGQPSVETDLGDDNVLQVIQSARKVKKEAMRMLQFVRFQQTKEGFYFCGIEPLYDVLPLVLNHFKSRFADQKWLLYDLRRNYGAWYDLKTVEEVELSTGEINRQTGRVSENVLDEGDAFYQTLWKSYFEHINIKERKNLKLQRQHMPRRFWRYLTEK